MAQTLPPPDSDMPRPLPRRPAPRPLTARANRPPFGPLDAVWMLVLAALSLAVLDAMGELTASHAAGIASAAGTVAALYLLGWRVRDRAAGVGTGLLAATSLPFLHMAAYSSQSAPFLLLTIAALFAFVAGSSLAALGLAAAATLIRPDGLLLGLLLLGLSFAQHRRRALIGAAIFLVPALAGWAARIILWHDALPLPALNFHLPPWLWTPSSLLLIWFLLPLCAELSEPMRRARWLPVILWTGLYLLGSSLYSLTGPEAMLLPLMALLFALAGGGLSRLLPALSGEIPTPLLRYVLAALAVTALVGLHVRLETPLPMSFNKSAAPGLDSLSAPAAPAGDPVPSGNSAQ